VKDISTYRVLDATETAEMLRAMERVRARVRKAAREIGRVSHGDLARDVAQPRQPA
jgi:hypothetical protein